MRGFIGCLVLVACGGGADATDAPLSDAELRAEILAEAERINSCDAVGDCQAKSFDCGAVYVNADADQSRLDELLATQRARSGNRECDASCRCGVLRCEANKCVTEAGDCMTPPADAMMVCL